MPDTESQPKPSDRQKWIDHLQRMARPVFEAAAGGRLREKMPVEQHAEGKFRDQVSQLEAVCRLIAGLAPWLELEPIPDGPENDLQSEFRELARRSIVALTNPGSPDFCDFTQYGQPLVEGAFLAQGLVRAPIQLVQKLPERARFDLTKALQATRVISPPFKNWLLFPAMIEAALHRLDAKWEPLRIEYAIHQHEQWYRGDGLYSDGPVLHLDYYNSFVIQPMLLDILDTVGHLRQWISPEYPAVALRRAQRYANHLERLISPEATFPPIGRSLAYRTGAFHLLAQLALKESLPKELKPGQVRSALTAVIERMLNAPGTFDPQGWLRIGFCGEQSTIGEKYISTGSLYLASAIFAPLGLADDQPFWAAPSEDWTARRLWSGRHAPIDHALSDRPII